MSVNLQASGVRLSGGTKCQRPRHLALVNNALSLSLSLSLARARALSLSLSLALSLALALSLSRSLSVTYTRWWETLVPV